MIDWLVTTPIVFIAHVLLGWLERIQGVLVNLDERPCIRQLRRDDCTGSDLTKRYQLANLMFAWHLITLRRPTKILAQKHGSCRGVLGGPRG